MRSPKRISHYPSGNMSKRGINERRDITISPKDVMRLAGQKTIIEDDERAKVMDLLKTAIVKYRQGYQKFMSTEPFVEIHEIYNPHQHER